jgi:predicted amidohydrolase YtcJ
VTFEVPGFVDPHTHLLRVSAGAPPPWSDEGLAGFHRRILADGSTPMDQPMALADHDGLAERLRVGLLRARRLGLCRITEAGMGDWAELDALLELRAANALPVAVRILVASGLADATGGAPAVAARRTGDPAVEVEGVKLYADGWLGPRTCALCTPFADDPDERGVLFLDGAAIARRATPYADAGLVVATHAIGDRAIEAVLAGYEAAFGGDRAALAAAGWRIEHCQVTRPDLVDGLAELGVIACIQPGFAPSDRAAALAGLGEERAAAAYDWPGMLAAGVRMIAGSDFPIESLDPLDGLADLVTGRGTGAPIVPIATALALMTDPAAGTTVLSHDPAEHQQPQEPQAPPLSVLDVTTPELGHPNV